MNVYIDTEFNGYRGALISMALVDADGNAFYNAVECSEPIVLWVAQNVMPVLYTGMDRHGGRLLTMEELQAALEWYLQQYDSVHLIADWPEDIEHFCRVLITGPGERINTPPLTMEVRRDLDAVSELPHNALADAQAIRRKHLELTK
jgi:hypothetical protein